MAKESEQDMVQRAEILKLSLPKDWQMVSPLKEMAPPLQSLLGTGGCTND